MSDPIFTPAEMFRTEPDWIDFTDIPTSTTLYTRRGLPYYKTGAGSGRELFEEAEIEEDISDKASVFDDWPYWSVDHG